MCITPQTALLLIAAAAVIWMLYEYLHRKRTRCAAFLTGTLSGIAALVLCHFFGARIGFVPPLTVCNLAAAAIAGIPAVILLAVMELLHL